MYRLTASLLNSWQRATDPEADENAYAGFLADLGREKRPAGPAAQAGIDFEDMVYRASRGDFTAVSDPGQDLAAAIAFGNRLRGAAYQVKATRSKLIAGMEINLVGIADFLQAGVITDIKRVQRYEYGKYQFSAQHPMYLELWPEATKFNYLIWDGGYAYQETYRRGDSEPIDAIAGRFLEYLRGADLMDIYTEKWEEKSNVYEL